MFDRLKRFLNNTSTSSAVKSPLYGINRKCYKVFYSTESAHSVFATLSSLLSFPLYPGTFISPNMAKLRFFQEDEVTHFGFVEFQRDLKWILKRLRVMYFLINSSNNKQCECKRFSRAFQGHYQVNLNPAVCQRSTNETNPYKRTPRLLYGEYPCGHATAIQLVLNLSVPRSSLT